MFGRQFQGICWFRGLQKSRFAVSILVTAFCWGGGFSCQTQVKTFMNAGTGAGKAVISAAGSRMGVRNMYLFMGGAAPVSYTHLRACTAQHRDIRFDGKSAF